MVGDNNKKTGYAEFSLSLAKTELNADWVAQNCLFKAQPIFFYFFFGWAKWAEFEDQEVLINFILQRKKENLSNLIQ